MRQHCFMRPFTDRHSFQLGTLRIEIVKVEFTPTSLFQSTALTGKSGKKEVWNK